MSHVDSLLALSVPVPGCGKTCQMGGVPLKCRGGPDMMHSHFNAFVMNFSKWLINSTHPHLTQSAHLCTDPA